MSSSVAVDRLERQNSSCMNVDIGSNNAPEPPKSFYQRVRTQITSILAQNLSPPLLALSIAVGFVCGLFPVPGLTSVICLAVCMFLPVNQAAAQIVNLLLTPIDIICVPMFVYFGELLLGHEHVSLSPIVLMEELRKDKMNAIGVYGGAFLKAILGWIVWCPLTVFTIRALLTPLLRMYMKKRPVS